MNTKKRPDIDEDVMDGSINPFTFSPDFKIKVRRSSLPNTWEHKDGIFLPKELDIEADKVVKLYATPDCRKAISGLHSMGKSLLLWIILEMDYGKDWLWINKARYMKENFIKDIRTYDAAVAELIRDGFLTYTGKSNEEVYWINPRYFFCGSRVNKYSGRKGIIEIL